MIEKLVIQKLTIAGKEYEYPDTTALVGKINELVDAVNLLQCKNVHIESDLQDLMYPKEIKGELGENVPAPITLLDVFNEMGRLYADLWNKMEDIHHDLKTKGGDNE